MQYNLDQIIQVFKDTFEQRFERVFMDVEADTLYVKVIVEMRDQTSRYGIVSPQIHDLMIRANYARQPFSEYVKFLADEVQQRIDELDSPESPIN